MEIFLSWSGDRSKALATALKEWIHKFFPKLEPWVSASNLQAGDRWSLEIARKLEESNFGIICITPENINAPWLLFEAGALSKKLFEGRVIPLLLDLDVKDISAPLNQFQMLKAEKDDFKEILITLNSTQTNNLSNENLEILFDSYWPSLEEKIKNIPAANEIEKPPRPQDEVLEDLVLAVKSLEARIRDSTDHNYFEKRNRDYHKNFMDLFNNKDKNLEQEEKWIEAIKNYIINKE